MIESDTTTEKETFKSAFPTPEDVSAISDSSPEVEEQRAIANDGLRHFLEQDIKRLSSVQESIPSDIYKQAIKTDEVLIRDYEASTGLKLDQGKPEKSLIAQSAVLFHKRSQALIEADPEEGRKLIVDLMNNIRNYFNTFRKQEAIDKQWGRIYDSADRYNYQEETLANDKKRRTYHNALITQLNECSSRAKMMEIEPLIYRNLDIKKDPDSGYYGEDRRMAAYYALELLKDEDRALYDEVKPLYNP